MTKITALSFSKGRNKKINISLDGKRAFSLGVDMVLSEKLKAGQEISAGRIEALRKADYQQQCYSAAARLLCYRPRSEHEMRQRLVKHGFDIETIETVITKLKGQGLINDIDFATFWRDTRQSFNPRSQWLTRVELKQKGISTEIIDQVTSNINDNDNAYNAAKKKRLSLKKTDYQLFRRKLGEYLKYRGFSYNVIINTIERLWQERQESQTA